MRFHRFHTTLLILCFSAVAAHRASAQEPPRGSITIDRIAEIKYPTEQTWSPDSKAVAFLWDAAGKQDLYMSEAGRAPVALTNFPVDPEMLTSNIGHFEWTSADSILFSKDGSLWTVSLPECKPARLAGFQGVALFSLSSDRKQITYVKGGEVWVGSLDGKTQRQLTRIADGSRLSAPAFSPDGQYVAFTASYSSDQPEPMPYNGDRMQVTRSRVWGTRLGIVSVFYGDPVMIPTSGAGGGAGAARAQWVAGPALVHEEYSGDRKSREIKITTVSGETRTLWKDYDARWISLADGPRTVTSPDGKQIAFISDRTGWAHLYVIAADATSESQARQLSKGEFGDGYANWSPDSRHISSRTASEGTSKNAFFRSPTQPPARYRR